MSDLSGEQEAAPASGEKPRRRPSRGLPDLTTLLEEVDRQDVQADVQVQTQPEGTGGIVDVIPPVSRRARGVKTLTSLLASDGEAADSLQLEAGRRAEPAPTSQARKPILTEAAFLSEEEAGEEEHLSIPEGLEAYLSPDLWRKLNSPAPARGVLFNALERVRSVLYLVSTFLPQNLVQEKMRRSYAGAAGGQMLRGSLLFADVSGFTALSERLAPPEAEGGERMTALAEPLGALRQEGAERLTAIMNQYFAAMLEILSWSGGILLKFAGDATLVFFPEQEAGEHANWAVRAGQRMLRAMADFTHIETPAGEVGLKMKVGLATGEFLAASAGSEQRMEYFVLGQAVNDTMMAEGLTTRGGQMVVNAATLQTLDAAFAWTAVKHGFYRVMLKDQEGLGEFEIKAETRRARGAMPWSASPRALLAQIEVALRQIQALTPYLAPELVERVVVNARRREFTSEFRPTTVLFCNFSGPEALLKLWGEAGAQRVTGLLNAYFMAMQQVVARYGGMISRVDPYRLGTKMLILFGAPVAHEDDPQRAVSAALAMNAELEALEESWRRRFGRHLPAEWSGPLIQQRIGITLGRTFAGQVGSSTRREYTVMGDQVNLAARLMGAAAMEQILVDQQVQNAVTSYFVVTTLPSIRVKGKSKPIAIYQVDGPREDTLFSRLQRQERLFGRQAELAQGEEILHSVIEGKHGAVLTILGPAGIGKSHLADELMKRAAARGARLLLNQCRSYNTNTAYAGWSGLLRDLACVTALDFNPRTILVKLQSLLRALNLEGGHLPPLAALMGLSASVLLPEVDEQGESEPGEGQGESFDFVKSGRIKRRGSNLDVLGQLDQRGAMEAGQAWQPLSAQFEGRQREALHQAVLALLEALAGAAPVVIFFEDAHWMDAASKDLLRFLHPRIDRLPVLLMQAGRGDEAEARAWVETSLSGEGRPDFGNTIWLGALEEAGSAALVAHLLVEDLAQVIHEQSNGNPLFVSEITRWFKRTRNLNAEELRGVLQTSNILQKLVLSSLETLPEMQREIAKVAAVVGYEFRTGEVQALLEASVDAVTLSNHLRGLAKEQVIILAEAGADARYAFHQTLVRDILYNSLSFEQRRAYHAKIAAYLSEAPSRRRRIQARIAAALEAGPANPAYEAERTAEHFELAQNWQEAAVHCLMAGDQLRLFQMYEQAAVDYGRAVADLKRLSPQAADGQAAGLKFEAYLGQGELALRLGEYLTALSAFEAAQANLAEGAEAGVKKDLWLNLALVLPTQNRADEALKWLRKVLKMPGVAEDAVIVGTMAWLLWRSEKAEASKWVRKGKALLASAADEWAVGVRTMLVDFGGDWQAAEAAYLALGKATGAALSAVRRGERQMAAGDDRSALTCFQQATELWGGGDNLSSGMALALYRQAEAYWQMQDLGAARQTLEKALAALPQSAALLQAGGNSAVPRAIKMVTKGKSKRWPIWQWQAYDDAFRIAMLYKP